MSNFSHANSKIRDQREGDLSLYVCSKRAWTLSSSQDNWSVLSYQPSHFCLTVSISSASD